MGIKSTFNISRQTAIAVIVSKINNCTNDQLASMLLDFDESYFRNYIVYHELPTGDNEWDKSIKTVDEFNQ